MRSQGQGRMESCKQAGEVPAVGNGYMTLTDETGEYYINMQSATLGKELSYRYTITEMTEHQRNNS